MSEPQIPGMLQGRPQEGNVPGPFGATSPGYTEGPTYPQPGYAPAGNPSVNPVIPVQRPAQRVGEWKW